MGNVILFKEVMNRLKNTDDKPYFHSTTVNRLLPPPPREGHLYFKHIYLGIVIRGRGGGLIRERAGRGGGNRGFTINPFGRG